MKREWMRGLTLSFLVIVLLFPFAAAGQMVTIDWAVNGSGEESGTITTNIDWVDVVANPDEPFYWNMQDQDGYAPIEIDLGGGHMAYIDGIEFAIKGDPYIDFGFAARSYNGPSHFTFSSELLVINPALAAGAEASAWAQVIPGVGATVTAGDFGGNVYLAEYNGGTPFEDLVPAPVVGFGQEIIGSTPIGVPVSSMQVHWGFTLSSGGQATGSSHFEINGDAIPEPATIALLGLGALALIRKR